MGGKISDRHLFGLRGARPADVFRSALVWAGFTGVVLVAVPPMLLGYPLVLVDPNRALADWYLRSLGRALVRVNPRWSITVEGREHLDKSTASVLVVNHQSLVDLLAMCFLHHPVKYLGKQSVFDVPIFGWALRVAGEIPVERGDRTSGSQARRRITEWLERGVSVAVFPEGTRSGDGSMGSFKPGAFQLAIAAKRPIVPVVLGGARDLLPKRSVVFARDAHIRVRVLPPVSTLGLGPSDAADLARRVRESMLGALDEIESSSP